MPAVLIGMRSRRPLKKMRDTAESQRCNDCRASFLHPAATTLANLRAAARATATCRHRADGASSSSGGFERRRRRLRHEAHKAIKTQACRAHLPLCRRGRAKKPWAAGPGRMRGRSRRSALQR